MARVKICGITRSADLRAAVEAGADAVGVIADVTVDTPREVDLADAAELVAEAPPFVTTTLVTMPDSPSDAVDAVRTVQPDVTQLHGEFEAEELGYLRSETGTKLAVAVDCEDADRARKLDSAVDALLIDSTTEAGAGGTGRTHDWEATRELTRELRSPVVLAGGLTPDNVGEAVRIAEPYAVDVASGVELTGGVKDHTALATFVRNAERSPEVVQ
ncbi:phosphoribosylanthranilate isomerase [Halalkaliarchaeum desulfuricum]|uniref:N-(5'-phosphoribosyl)anthranilate isomerase n=1 Tax=Halalkaliarchaeum desulfuricum TaxID=2055893 RepID=A0A343TIC0_9EURY|nr:phosphoribosylanthranilate isomerase [Halalkaliarchaeum desulfuricum]AUX08842.1 phosphoribosylanthranilate isomerase [Halalkaliarchaeum desulfuricum]